MVFECIPTILVSDSTHQRTGGQFREKSVEVSLKSWDQNDRLDSFQEKEHGVLYPSVESCQVLFFFFYGKICNFKK